MANVERRKSHLKSLMAIFCTFTISKALGLLGVSLLLAIILRKILAAA